MNNKSLSDLINIGSTVEARLNGIGIHNQLELKQFGAANAYRALSQQNPGVHLPVCYYLYSLAGALQDRHWDDFSDEEKAKLRQEAGLETPSGS